MTLDIQDRKDIIENSFSWIVVLAMFVYGAAKFVQFEGATDVDKTVAEMTGMELMWAFYGYSKFFALTLGFLEVTGGILILFRRTRILGCLFTSGILLNIILQDIVYGVNLGALKAAIFYQVMIFAVLWMNREKLIQGLRNLLINGKRNAITKKHVLKFVIAFVGFVLIRIVEYIFTH